MLKIQLEIDQVDEEDYLFIMVHLFRALSNAS